MVWKSSYSEKELERKLFIILFLGLENKRRNKNNKKKQKEQKERKNSNNSVMQAQSNSSWSATKFSIFVNIT